MKISKYKLDKTIRIERKYKVPKVLQIGLISKLRNTHFSSTLNDIIHFQLTKNISILYTLKKITAIL